jgi:L-2-hydroxyglutarate oxidase LhgO
LGRYREFLVVGSGIAGPTIARELLFPGADSISIVDKEMASGARANGRNSGVIHCLHALERELVTSGRVTMSCGLE